MNLLSGGPARNSFSESGQYKVHKVCHLNLTTPLLRWFCHEHPRLRARLGTMPKARQLISGIVDIQTFDKDVDSVWSVSNRKPRAKGSPERARKKPLLSRSSGFCIMWFLPLMKTFPNLCMVILYKALSHSVREGGRAKERISFQPAAPQSIMLFIYFLIQKGRKIRVNQPTHRTRHWPQFSLSRWLRKRIWPYLWKGGALVSLPHTCLYCLNLVLLWAWKPTCTFGSKKQRKGGGSRQT